jgi:hypothetical protein
MGMTANLLAVNPADLERMKADPEQLANLIHDEVEGLRVNNIDKSWEGLLFLLTGQGSAGLQAQPITHLGRALFSGRLIDAAQDLGYGPAHYLEADEVAAVAKELNAIRVEDLEARFDPAEMMRQEIYPVIWDRVDDDLKGYLLDYFDELKMVYQTAAEKGDAMITFIS